MLGRHSGRRAVAHRLQGLGIPHNEATVNRIVERLKLLSKGTIVDDVLLQRIAADVH
ncbi:MAG: hypothetical protein ACKPJD_25500 [Planctomycetaceae bacterium]